MTPEEHALARLTPATLRVYAALLAARRVTGTPPSMRAVVALAARERGCCVPALEVLVRGTAMVFESGARTHLYRERQHPPRGHVVFNMPQPLWAIVARGEVPQVPLYALRDIGGGREFERLPEDLPALARYADAWERPQRQPAEGMEANHA